MTKFALRSAILSAVQPGVCCVFFGLTPATLLLLYAALYGVANKSAAFQVYDVIITRLDASCWNKNHNNAEIIFDLPAPTKYLLHK